MRNGRGAPERDGVPERGFSRRGRGAFKGPAVAPTGPANAARLLLRFYFHIILISKGCLAALAFASDKRRALRRAWKGGERKERVEGRGTGGGRGEHHVLTPLQAHDIYGRSSVGLLQFSASITTVPGSRSHQTHCFIDNKVTTNSPQS